ncbi:VIT1/CCC1 transporter family protein [Candidatus Micrarchaeota archaeon]|nr:VIT1/CCC1 transporter family protein [Candidatus Micrarchaeota archaeon]
MKSKYYDLEKHIREEHGGAAAKLREFILGWQDGLVNVLGIILGIAAATSDSRIVIIAGIAATFAESVSMAAVAYTSIKAEIDFYEKEKGREAGEIEENKGDEIKEVYEVYYRKGFRGALLKKIVDKISSDKKLLLDFMMNEELGLERVGRHKPFNDALLVGFSAVVGSLIPLLPFFFLPVSTAILGSVAISLVSLFAVGALKAKTTVGKPLNAGIEMMLIGGLAAGVGYVIGAVLGVTLA